MQLTIRYYKPRSRRFSSSIVETPDLISKITVIRERQRTKAKRNIPVAANIHSGTFLELSVITGTTKNCSLLPVAHYLALSIKEEYQTEVLVKMDDMVKDLNLSEKSIIKAIDILEEKFLIARVGRGKYEISPRLAFFGDPFDWSIALEYEKEGIEFVKEKIQETKHQMQQADEEHARQINKTLTNGVK